MKTKWGECNRCDRRVWLNLVLAKESVGCIEYIVVYELVHLLVPSEDSVHRDDGLVPSRLAKPEGATDLVAVAERNLDLLNS